MTVTLTKPALPALQQLVALLVDHDITPLHLHADSVATEQPRASLTLWTHTRTEIERLAAALGRTPAERTGHGRAGYRLRWIFTVERHDDDRGPLRDLADWHDTKAEKARRFPGVGPENAAVMEKAAQVHEDAARRIREAVSHG